MLHVCTTYSHDCICILQVGNSEIKEGGDCISKIAEGFMAVNEEFSIRESRCILKY